MMFLFHQLGSLNPLDTVQRSLVVVTTFMSSSSLISYLFMVKNKPLLYIPLQTSPVPSLFYSYCLQTGEVTYTN